MPGDNLLKRTYDGKDGPADTKSTTESKEENVREVCKSLFTGNKNDKSLPKKAEAREMAKERERLKKEDEWFEKRYRKQGISSEEQRLREREGWLSLPPQIRNAMQALERAGGRWGEGGLPTRESLLSLPEEILKYSPDVRKIILNLHATRLENHPLVWSERNRGNRPSGPRL